MSTDRGDLVQLTPRYLGAGHLRHAYALTGHSGQGVTVDRAFVLASGDGQLQEWGYVALSRARTETRLYVTADAQERESHFHDLDDRGAVTQVAQALEQSAIERLAVDQRPRAPGSSRSARAELERSAHTTEHQAQLRLVEQQWRATQDLRSGVERRLKDAECRLERLGRFGHRDEKSAARSEVAMCRAALQSAERRTMALELQLHHLQQAAPASETELPLSRGEPAALAPRSASAAELGIAMDSGER